MQPLMRLPVGEGHRPKAVGSTGASPSPPGEDGAHDSDLRRQRASLLAMHDVYPTKEALDSAIGFGEGLRESFEQLDELLVTLGSSR